VQPLGFFFFEGTHMGAAVKSRWGLMLLAGAFVVVLVGSAPWMRPEPFSDSGGSWETLAVDAVRAIKAGMIDRAYELCDKAMTVAAPAKNGDTQLSRTYTLLGEIHNSAGKPTEARSAFLQGVTLCEKSCGPMSREMLEPLDALANFHFYREEMAEVEPLYGRMEIITELIRAQAERDLANRARNLAELQRVLGKFVEADAEYRKCLAAGKSAGEVFRSDYLQDTLLVADFYRERGNLERAEELAGDALLMAEELSGAESMDVVMALDCSAKVALGAAKPQAAEVACRRALEITEGISGAESSDLAPRLAMLATALAAQDQGAEAAKYLERALAVTEADLGPEAPEVADLLDQYATILESDGKPAEAEIAVTRAAAIRELVANPKPADVADCEGCGIE
jgi:tetratricopeptide (TPR) repeat protein